MLYSRSLLFTYFICRRQFPRVVSSYACADQDLAEPSSRTGSFCCPVPHPQGPFPGQGASLVSLDSQLHLLAQGSLGSAYFLPFPVLHADTLSWQKSGSSCWLCWVFFSSRITVWRCLRLNVLKTVVSYTCLWYIVLFWAVWGGRVNLVPVTPSWLEAEPLS